MGFITGGPTEAIIVSGCFHRKPLIVVSVNLYLLELLLLVVSGVIDNWQARRLIMQLLAVFIPGYCLCGYHSDDVLKYKYVVGGKICFDPNILIFFIKILHCPCFVHV